MVLLYFSGTDEERGIKMWRVIAKGSTRSFHSEEDVYTIRCLQKYFDQWTIAKYLPFCPTFRLNVRDSNDDTNLKEPGPPVGGFVNVALEDEKTEL